MNLPNPEHNDHLFYLWLCFVCFIAGLCGIAHRGELAALHGFKRFARLVVLTATSMVTGYLVFEVALYVTTTPRLSLAAAGIGAYLGADTLDTIQKIVIGWIERGKR